MACHVVVTDDAVDITFTGLDAFFCFTRHQHLATADITSARIVDREEATKGRRWRVRGGSWPGVLATGWSTVEGRKGARQLWCVYRDQELLVIDTRLERPCRVVLQHPDRHNLAWLIGERVSPA